MIRIVIEQTADSSWRWELVEGEDTITSSEVDGEYDHFHSAEQACHDAALALSALPSEPIKKHLKVEIQSWKFLAWCFNPRVSVTVKARTHDQAVTKAKAILPPVGWDLELVEVAVGKACK